VRHGFQCPQPTLKFEVYFSEHVDKENGIILADAAMFIFTFRDHFHTPALEGVLLAILEHKAKFINFLYLNVCGCTDGYLAGDPKTFCLLKPLRNYILIICSWFFSLFIASSSINTHIQVMTFVERNNTSFMNMEDIEEIIFYKCRIVQFWSCLCWVEKRITSSLLKRLRINMKLHWSSIFFFSFSITPPHFIFIPLFFISILSFFFQFFFFLTII
jgi:hypothetical protein